MNICIGGDLDGQICNLDKSRFKSQEIDESKTSEYYRQRYIMGDNSYYFWISMDLNLSDATDRVENLLRKPKS